MNLNVKLLELYCLEFITMNLYEQSQNDLNDLSRFIIVPKFEICILIDDLFYQGVIFLNNFNLES